ncbi:MAG: aminotransferase class IV [Tunicatimonas sp.]
MHDLLESIKLENGHWHQLPYHEQRLQRAQLDLFGEVTIQDLARQITVPDDARLGVYKCRVLYSQQIERVEFLPYQQRPVRTLRRVHCDSIDYSHKYADRSLLNQLFAQRGDCDDVLIVKNGLVTDTSYANIVFFDGQAWVTPAQPLLRGTQRQYLLDAGRIREDIIEERILKRFQKFQIINAFHAFPGFSYAISGLL